MRKWHTVALLALSIVILLCGAAHASGKSAIKRKLLAITGAFEGGGFDNLDGNFDGQGISFGVLQWNFGTGSLGPLLLKMYRRDPDAFRDAVGSGTTQLLRVAGSSCSTQLAFARQISSAHRVCEPWRLRFKALGRVAAFQTVQMEAAQYYFDVALRLHRRLGLHSERALAVMFDVAVQNGGIPDWMIAWAMERRFDCSERDFLVLVIRRRAESVRPRFRADVLSRKLCIIRGAGTVHGDHYNLEERFGLTDQPIPFTSW